MARTLTLFDDESGLSFLVGFDRWDLDRAQFRYVISCGSETLAVGSDLRMGSGAEPIEAQALEALLGFLSAYAEAVEHETRTGGVSDNADLFPPTMRDAAYTIGSDGFAMLAESLARPEPEFAPMAKPDLDDYAGFAR